LQKRERDQRCLEPGWEKSARGHRGALGAALGTDSARFPRIDYGGGNMKTVIVALFFANSFAASGGPVSKLPTFLDVEVWGTVTSNRGNDVPAIGDSIYQRLRIDPSLAPPPQTSTPTGVQYSSFRTSDCCDRPTYHPSGFVTTVGHALLSGDSFDELAIYDGSAYYLHDRDAFIVGDAESIQDSSRVLTNSVYTNVSVFDLTDFIHGKSFWQSFDLRPARSPSNRGVFDETVDRVEHAFSYMVDRIRVTPRVCRP
jgi:hypothetical protein